MLFDPHHRIWDFWAVHDKHQYHLYFLQAPRAGHAYIRHDLASIGHAVSSDLIHWQRRQDALHKGRAGQWDDLSLWTGSVMGYQDKWFMFYTGRDARTRTQNIGLAVSDNLDIWTRFGQSPILYPHSKWYMTGSEETPESFTWRDPFVVYDPHSQLFYLLIACHDRSRPLGYQGAIGYAVSEDLYHWTLMPPLLSPGWFQHLEVPTIIWWEDAWYLFVSVKAEWFHPSSPFGRPITGTLCFRSQNITGPFVVVKPPIVVEKWYALRPVNLGTQWGLLGWRMGEEEGYPQHPFPYGVDNPKGLIQTANHTLQIINL